MSKTVKPASKQLFCKPDEAETTTKSGIILAQSTAEKPRTAQVINIGKEVIGFKSKETIIYKAYASTEIKLNGEEYFLISEEDVLGTVVDGG